MQKNIHIPEPYKAQEDIENDPHRFRVVACGRRWGKTYMAMREIFQMLLRGWTKTKRRQRGWVVAPTFPLVREDWLIAEQILRDAIVDKKLTEMKMDFGTVGFIEFKSAERDDEGLRGAGLDCVVVDEASRVSKKSWEMGIRPALADKQGRAIFISTPKSRNWFYEMYMLGQEENPEIKSWKYPTYTNPYFPKSEWEVIVRTTPEITRKQEYEADFLENEGSVFRNIDRCMRGDIEEPIDSEYYTIGLDLAKSEDFTVATVVKNSTAQVVDIYRQNQVDWSLQKAQVIALTKRYKRSVVYIDSTGLGDPLEEDLRKSGVITKDYKFTYQSKEELVEQLIVAIEQGLIGIPECEKTKFLIDELKIFTYEKLESGRIRYSAPEGYHDDGVISLGLAIRGISHLLYNKPKYEEKKKRWGTADDWERLYKSIDNECGKNKWISREQAIQNIKARNFRRKLIHA